MKENSPIKFLDLKAINQAFEPELSETILQISRSGQYVNGEISAKFEKNFADYIGTQHCISLGNGTNALELILRAYLILGHLKEGDEVLVPANTFFATFLAISNQRLIPVAVEPELTSFNISARSLEQKITKKSRALVLVHLFGRNAYSEEIKQLIDKHQLKLIEDNAQAVGCMFKGVRTGALGHVSAHSFYPAKNLGALGDAGAVTTNEQELANIIRALTNYGGTEKHKYEYIGTHSKMDEIQAGVLNVKLPHLDKNNCRRDEIASVYLDRIDSCHVTLPLKSKPSPFLSHTWHLFTLLVSNRERLIQYLSQKGIETAIHYPIPPHLQPAYRKMNFGKLPLTERIHREILSIPLHPSLRENEVSTIIESINKWEGK
ncbi:MAG: DegT/DnrJ/EryC1/StrS family aminotransferase [Cytophagales bacterium]|uniref:DegT/DnrJ/EryC1/StrS family aminotransferase n=1 Tax=Cyclobacterium marinum TaxID=104 RepID=UPI0011EEE652|nr:DegT/DnrJ/EryC1/StrS family aminotransferase [Cyclobacterium marinum]MBI0398863.1 DegT/DnrJ/EryC1/StrS family aminotransferase [Cyclobacterium marinum]MBR9774213.1 DegT/DnrJ/EryC1/StrS family aminotransferase [Cytophagales bacterium]|tara:strand:+ start:55480 stop:56610 length:1131 start_codon:yes stop_codon:yes gene_type:complete